MTHWNPLELQFSIPICRSTGEIYDFISLKGYGHLTQLNLDGTSSHLQVATLYFKGIQQSITSLYTVDTVSKTVDSGNWESLKDHLKVPGHILPETRTITPHSLFPTVHHPHIPPSPPQLQLGELCYSMIPCMYMQVYTH